MTHDEKRKHNAGTACYLSSQKFNKDVEKI